MSMLDSAERAISSTMATAALGAKAMAASSRFDGRWVKTIVDSSPKRSASPVATRNEAVWSDADHKEDDAECPQRSVETGREPVGDERLDHEPAAEGVRGE